MNVSIPIGLLFILLVFEIRVKRVYAARKRARSMHVVTLRVLYDRVGDNSDSA